MGLTNNKGHLTLKNWDWSNRTGVWLISITYINGIWPSNIGHIIDTWAKIKTVGWNRFLHGLHRLYRANLFTSFLSLIIMKQLNTTSKLASSCFAPASRYIFQKLTVRKLPLRSRKDRRVTRKQECIPFGLIWGIEHGSRVVDWW